MSLRRESIGPHQKALALGYQGLDDALRSMYAQGMGTKRMAKALSFTKQAIQYRLRRMGLR